MASKVLTDTHSLVWALSEPDRLSRKARTAFETMEVHVSVANLWELALKAGRSGALVSEPETWWSRYVAGSGISVLPIRISHVLRTISLPSIHKDPFDRILVAQSLIEDMALITKDAALGRYGVAAIW